MIFFPTETSKYPKAEVQIQLIHGYRKTLQAPLSRLAIKGPWRKGNVLRSTMLTFMAKNPVDPDAALEAGDNECLWYALENRRFMVPCRVIGEIPDITGVEPVEIEIMDGYDPNPPEPEEEPEPERVVDLWAWS